MGDTPQSNLYAGNALVGGAVAATLYFPVFEGVWGRSLGKLLAGLKVVDRHGRAPGLGRATVRTLFRLFEVNPVLAGGAPAGIAVLLTKRKRRLGDLAAGTYVLRAETVKYLLLTDSTLAEMRGS